MIRSSTSAPGASPRAPKEIFGDALRHWRVGVGMMVLVATVLAFRGLHSATHVYESFAVFELTEGAAAASMTSGEGRAPTSDTGPSPERALRDALPELNLPNSADEALAPGSAAVRRLSGGRATLVCRADEAHSAHQRCAQAAMTAAQANHALRIVQQATLPARPLAAAGDASSVVLVVSGLIGLIGGWLWMLARAIVRVGPTTQSSARDSSKGLQTVSQSAPFVQETVASPSQRSEPAGPPSDDERGQARREVDSATKPAGTFERRSHAEGETRAVVSVSVAGDWKMDQSLTYPNADLRGLCDKLAELQPLCSQFGGGVASECFVVGVTSRLDDGPLKARLAARLAWLLAQNERARILLLEIDLNCPRVDSVMQLAVPPGAGVSQQIEAQRHERAQTPWTVVRCTPHLSVLAEGLLRTPGVAYLPQFPAALSSLRPHFDVIVAHGPAIGGSADASTIADLVDGVVFAVPSGMSNPEAQVSASQWLQSPVLAVAALRDPAP